MGVGNYSEYKNTETTQTCTKGLQQIIILWMLSYGHHGKGGLYVLLDTRLLSGLAQVTGLPQAPSSLVGSKVGYSGSALAAFPERISGTQQWGERRHTSLSLLGYMSLFKQYWFFLCILGFVRCLEFSDWERDGIRIFK